MDLFKSFLRVTQVSSTVCICETVFKYLMHAISSCCFNKRMFVRTTFSQRGFNIRFKHTRSLFVLGWVQSFLSFPFISGRFFYMANDPPWWSCVGLKATTSCWLHFHYKVKLCGIFTCLFINVSVLAFDFGVDHLHLTSTLRGWTKCVLMQNSACTDIVMRSWVGKTIKSAL